MSDLGDMLAAHPWKDPRVLQANLDVALEALERVTDMITLTVPDRVRFSQAQVVISDWIREGATIPPVMMRSEATGSEATGSEASASPSPGARVKATSVDDRTGQPVYTLAEARWILALEECRADGHDFQEDILRDGFGQFMRNWITCSRCRMGFSETYREKETDE